MQKPNLQTKVAVIGPFFNDERHVDAWVYQLNRQAYPYFAVYAVDDGSSDLTAESLRGWVSRVPFKLTLISQPTNSGPSAARNQAIRRALQDGAELILLLDSDARVDFDWIERHVALHESRIEVGICGGAIQGTANTWVGTADGLSSWFTAVPGSASGEVKRMHLSTTNWSMKRRVVEKVGFFDEELATGEDVAYCRRAQKAGEMLWFQSDIVMRHLDRDDLNAALRHHYRWGLHSFTLSTKDHGGYYGVMKKIRPKILALALIPAIAVLNVILILAKYSRRQPKVWLYLPWIAILKVSNAIGVYKGFRKPSLCLRPPKVAPLAGAREEWRTPSHRATLA